MDKALYVREMFASIAPRYDVVNRLLTGGIDEQWRRRAVRELAIGPKSSVIDLCCGTGDLSFHMLKRDPSTQIVGADFCVPMLEGARRRALSLAPCRTDRFCGSRCTCASLCRRYVRRSGDGLFHAQRHRSR